MPNPRRGEVEAVLDGRPRTLVLTLGALAELEAAFGADDLMALAERFARGRLSARDAARIIAAGLNGAGESVTLDEVERMRAEGGAAGFAHMVANLLSATFGAEASPTGTPGPEAPPASPTVPQRA
ncbi:gene transfer agent family protein [Xanthobacter sp. AM11]|uniref:gene transfer agent family protein n=1 Tax=Xanthobacter sp. AM11 TaxID=3380643 RepID=UPI0039BFA8B1